MDPRTSSVDNGGIPPDQEPRSIHASKRVRRGVDSVRGRARRLTAGARRASEGASNYVKSGPIRTILIAVAVGAALSAVVGLINRSREHG